jgi:hypothetical protein
MKTVMVMGGSSENTTSFRGDAQHRTMVRNCAPENLEMTRSITTALIVVDASAIIEQ